MELSCVRCKNKKVKCDRAEPCHQCVTAKTECHYVERRQRLRLAQKRFAVQDLNERIAFLERQIAIAGIENGEQQSPSTSSTTPISVTESVKTVNASQSSTVPSPDELVAENGQETFIYRMAADVRRNFQNQTTTPNSAPTPTIDGAMSSLNEALEDLGKIRIRTDVQRSGAGFHLSPTESRKCIDNFVDLLNNMVIPDIFAFIIDLELLHSLPDIIDSPYVQIEPGIRTLYYNALYYGIQQERSPGDPLVHASYLKILDTVPAWLKSQSLPDVDGHTAALSGWAAVNNHDHQLAWMFHCKSCQFIKTKAIDQIDVVPAKTYDEENKRNEFRYLYWQVLTNDITFRLLYGKPTMVRWTPHKIRPPSIITPHRPHPSATRVAILAMWTRYTLLTAETLNSIDDRASQEFDQAFSETIDSFCTAMEDLISEFDLYSIMKKETTTPTIKYLVAEHIINMNSIIVGIKRMTKISHQTHIVDHISLCASRRVVSLILEFNDTEATSSPQQTTNPQSTATIDPVTDIFTRCFISFYPFCAIFSLYEQILACSNPNDCSEDIASLEKLATAMAQAPALRPEFSAFTKTINALNKLSRTIQDERRKVSRSTDALSDNSSDLPTTFDRDALHNLMPDLDMSDAFPLFENLQYENGDGNGNPLRFVRALENDFIGRNWNEDWWVIGDGGINDGQVDDQYT